MAAGFVRVSLIGNLGKDPEVRFTASGTAVCNMRVACTERAKTREGNWEDKTEWVSLVCFGKTAENAGQFLQKGRQVFAEGRLQTREWNDKDGNKRYSTEVLADKVMFLGSGPNAGGVREQRPTPAHSGAFDDVPPHPVDENMPF
ncbi:MAG: single-stranded DNA-binding protein [Myxococcota bacterium]